MNLKSALKSLVRQTPLIGSLARKCIRIIRPPAVTEAFPGSERYWEQRYIKGGNSGAGSYDHLAVFKSEVINSFVSEHQVRSVIEFGCGDGNQLKYAEYERYLGFDVSSHSIESCKTLFNADPTKTFKLASDYSEDRAELVLSLDVIYHLIEDDVFEQYMSNLFKSSTRFVAVYASNTDENPEPRDPHVLHRNFDKWIKTNACEWVLAKHIPNRYPVDGETLPGSFADFYIYKKR